MTVQSLFKENVDLMQQLKDLYPVSSYKQRPTFALHFLIAHGQPLQTIKNYIIKNPNRLTQADPINFELTPLHVAAMKGDEARSKVLINASDNLSELINHKDARGWTPLHHAAITSAALFQHCIDLGGDPSLKTNDGADCDDLLKLTGRMRDIRSSKTLFVKEGEELVLLSEMTEYAKEALFGKEFFFTDSPLYPKEMFHQLYLNNEQSPWLDLKNVIPELYEAFRINPPPLFIDQCEEMKKISPHFLDCKAKEKILSGSILAEYSGIKDDSPSKQSFIEKFSKEEFLNEEYLLEGINSQKTGNEARFFNTGFPNAINVAHILRGVKRCLLVAIRDIEPEEPIRWDYGMKIYPLSFGRSLLLGKDEMISFFQKNKDTFFDSFQQMRNNFHKNPTLDVCLKICHYQSPIHYVLSSPTALLYLHFHNIIHCDVWKNGMQDSNNNLCHSWVTNNSFEYPFLLCIFHILSKLDKFCGNDVVKTAVYCWAVQKLEEQTVIDILKSLDLLSKKSRINSLDKLEAILKEIDQKMIDYDWQKDLENYPFNVERRAQLILDFYKAIPKKLLKSQIEEGLLTIEKNTESYQINELVLKKL